MNIILMTPAPPRSRKGNRVTALRWAALLRQLGHRVQVRQVYRGERSDLLIALHARRSFPAVDAFRRSQPGRPIVLALTGTDVYKEIHTDPLARQSLELASRLVVLQPLAVEELPTHLRARARVIYQSCQPPPQENRRARIEHRGSRIEAVTRGDRPSSIIDPRSSFDVCVLGHLRPVKDPFRTAEAARLLPASSRIRVLHAGAALSPAMEHQARAEEAINSRYRWLGDLPRWKALRLLARSRLLVLTSLMEGGANTISEAIAAGVPVLASRIPGSVGLLGTQYPGYFPVDDTAALAALLTRAETDTKFYEKLKAWCRRLRRLVRPARERESWRRLLRELRPTGLPTSSNGPTAGRKRRRIFLPVGSEKRSTQEVS
jgi:glycosyltransferase involved in cell wall biosynthesis